jgi:hypothetical protein
MDPASIIQPAAVDGSPSLRLAVAAYLARYKGPVSITQRGEPDGDVENP